MTGHERVFVGRVGVELIAFALNSVREVIDAPGIQALPLAPEALLGHLVLREAHLSVLDAGVLLGIQSNGSTAGIALVFDDGFSLRLDDAVDVWERDAAAVLPVPAGTDRVGLLRGLLRHGNNVAAFVDAAALRARALATLREHSHV
jgi:chemotaxis signal transduction protein